MRSTWPRPRLGKLSLFLFILSYLHPSKSSLKGTLWAANPHSKSNIKDVVLFIESTGISHQCWADTDKGTITVVPKKMNDIQALSQLCPLVELSPKRWQAHPFPRWMVQRSFQKRIRVTMSPEQVTLSFLFSRLLVASALLAVWSRCLGKTVICGI